MDERQQERGERFRALHEGDPFLIPNPWDAGSAKVMEALGFEALATTSSGFAFTLGRPDGGATLDQLVEHVGVMAAATQLPLSVDLENGHGPAPEDVATAIERVAEAGAVGCSIEDFDPRGHLYELAEARERIAAAVEVARRLPFPFTLTARAENHIRGNPDLDDTIARLLAYQEEGADVLFAPGLRDSTEIRRICDAVERPVNVLGHAGLSVSEITDAGAQRISVGGALAWTAIEAMVGAAEAMRDSGDLSGLSRPGRIREWI